MTTLRERMTKELELARLSPNTQMAYLRAVEGLARYYWRQPDRISVEEIRTYLHHELVERKLAWSSVNVCAAGLGFFYTKVLDWKDFRAALPPRTRRKALPDVLSQEEVWRLLEAAKNPKHHALLSATYAAGLRVSEVTHLKVTHVDGDRMTVRVEQGKGFKDRYVALSERLLVELREYWKIRRPPVWLFPGPDINRPLTTRSASRAYEQAREAAGITRGRGIHTLRHCFATHLLEAGTDSTVIKQVLGHAYISTTARYLRVTNHHLAKVKSPLDCLPPPLPTAP